MRTDVLPHGWPRGLNRFEAADYVGIGVTFFDEEVKGGRMPKPKRIKGTRKKGRLIYDRYELDAYISDLPHDGEDDEPPDPQV